MVVAAGILNADSCVYFSTAALFVHALVESSKSDLKLEAAHPTFTISNSKHLQLANQLHQHNLGKCKLGCYSRYIFFHNETYMNTIYVYTIYVYHTYQILWFLTILTYFPYESSVETHLRLERRKNVSEWRLLTFVGCIQSSIPPPLQECTELWLNILKWFFHFIMGHPIHHISYI